MSEAELLLETDSSVLILTMNRPQRRNAMTRSLAERIAAALDELDQRSDLAAAVLTGAGNTFCSGMDLDGFLAGELPSVPGRGFGGLTERPPAKPLIAAVEGYALAGGFELVLACDLAVAASDAVFGLPEVRRGLVARGGGLFRLPERLPRAIALEVILTGDPLSADRADSLGLVNRVVPPGTALLHATTLARTIAANAPLAVHASKRIVNESPSWPLNERFSRQRAFTDPVFESGDAKEGARAFAEKRAPVWTRT
jgi:enoyl-CoA hydratase